MDSKFDFKNDNELLNHVISYYHFTLKHSPQMLTQLQKLGIENAETINQFKIGFSDRSLGKALPEKNRKYGARIRGALQRIGLYKSNGRELFRGSIDVPVIENGVVKHIYGRKISNRIRAGTPIHTHLPNSKPGYFNLQAIEICEEVIFCSTIFDALVLWSAGYKNVTSIYGDNWLSEELIFNQLQSSAVKRAIIAFPNKDEDKSLADSLSEKLKQCGLDHYCIELPHDMDITKYAIKNAPASKSLGELIRKATWHGKGRDNDNVTVDTLEKAEDVGDSSCSLPEEKTTQFHNDRVATIPAAVIPEIHEDIDFVSKGEELLLTLDDLIYRVRGLRSNLSFEQLKVNILVSKGYAVHVDIINLYKDSARNNFIKQAALELSVKEEIIKQDLSRILLKLEVLQQENINETLKPKAKEIRLTKKEIKEAKCLLESANLIKRVLDDIRMCGFVGEATNILVAFLATLSRLFSEPLAIIVQSSSAAGKSALMDTAFALIPEEDKVQYSEITGQSLYYAPPNSLRNKAFGILEQEGASKASYSLKLLQSDGKLTISSTGKDPDTGKHVAREYHVEGPVMIFSTTTAIDIDDELLNRCLVLTVDEDRQQTRAIQEQQRFQETLDGLLAVKQREDILKLHRNAQRLLKPVKVINPYAEQLTFINNKTRTRRDHKKYLTLIRTITLLHQYQREVKTTYLGGKQISYIEVTLDDIELANSLVNDILGRSLDDLPPQTQRLLHLIDKMVNEECDSLRLDRDFYQFTRRDVRNYCGWGNTQLKVHLKRLEEMEYLLVKQGGRGKQIVYELLYNSEGKDGQPFLMGLLDVDTLRQKQKDKQKSDLNTNMSGASRPQVGKVSHACRHKKKRYSIKNNRLLNEKEASQSENMLLTENLPPASYHQHPSHHSFQRGNV